MSQYDADALMAYYKKHQISRRTAVVGGAVVVVAGASGAYLALGPGGQPEQMEPKPTAPSTPTAPSRPSAPGRPTAPAPRSAPAPAPSPAPQEKKRLIIAITESMETLFPLAYPPGGTGPHRTIANFQEMLIYQNLDIASHGGQIVQIPILAASPESIRPIPGARPGDWSKIRVTLRPNVRFHSGAKLTSESLAGPFSYKAVYDKSNWRFYWARTKGEIVDDLTADIDFGRSSTIANLTGFQHSGRPFLWNPAWVEETGFDKAKLGGEDQDGTGPFKVKEWTPGVRIIMERNRDYWGDTQPDADKHPDWGQQSGNVDELIYVFIREPSAAVTALKAGDIDVLVETQLYLVSDLDRHPKINTFNSGPANMLHIYLNTLYKPLQDQRVRQAITHSIDARGLRAIFDDRNPIAQSIFLPWMLGFDPNRKCWQPVDIGKAKQLLSESGYKDGFDLNVAPDSRDENALIGAALGPMIAKTGIDARVSITQVAEWNTVTHDREQTKLHMYPLTLGYRRESIDFFDFWWRAGFRRLRSSMEIPFLHGTFDPRKQQRGRPDFGLLGDISREPDEAKRIKLYHQAADYVMQEALIVIPTYFTRTASMRSKIVNWDKGPVWRGNGNYNAYRTKLA